METVRETTTTTVTETAAPEAPPALALPESSETVAIKTGQLIEQVRSLTEQVQTATQRAEQAERTATAAQAETSTLRTRLETAQPEHVESDTIAETTVVAAELEETPQAETPPPPVKKRGPLMKFLLG